MQNNIFNTSKKKKKNMITTMKINNSFTKCQLQLRKYENANDKNNEEKLKHRQLRHVQHYNIANQPIQSWNYTNSNKSIQNSQNSRDLQERDATSNHGQLYNGILKLLQCENKEDQSCVIIDNLFDNNDANEAISRNSKRIPIQNKHNNEYRVSIATQSAKYKYNESTSCGNSVLTMRHNLIKKILHTREEISALQFETAQFQNESNVIQIALDKRHDELNTLKQIRNDYYQQILERTEDSSNECKFYNSQITSFTDRFMSQKEEDIAWKKKKANNHISLMNSNHQLQLEILHLKQRCEEWKDKHNKRWNSSITKAQEGLQTDIRNMKVQMEHNFQRTVSEISAKTREKVQESKQHYKNRIKYAQQHIDNHCLAIKNELFPHAHLLDSRLDQLTKKQSQIETIVKEVDNKTKHLRAINQNKKKEYDILINYMNALQLQRVLQQQKWLVLISTATTEENVLVHAIEKEKQFQTVFKRTLEDTISDINALRKQWEEFISEIKRTIELAEHRIESQSTNSIQLSSLLDSNNALNSPQYLEFKVKIDEWYKMSLRDEINKWEAWQSQQYELQQYRILSEQVTKTQVGLKEN
jgi:hypothetical protein